MEQLFWACKSSSNVMTTCSVFKGGGRGPQCLARAPTTSGITGVNFMIGVSQAAEVAEEELVRSGEVLEVATCAL